MKKKVLLIEPPYRSVFLPLGLQKIATYELERKNIVKFIYGYPNFSFLEKDSFHFIYITSLFTYEGMKVIKAINLCKDTFPRAEIKVGGIFATLMPDFIEEQTGIKPHKGIWKRIDSLSPNYSLFPKTEQGIVFTTRGCVHKCEFCAVKTLEPKYYIMKNWKEQFKTAYDFGIRYFMIQDNNFLAAPFDHQKEVIHHLEKNYSDCRFEFNGGLDCRIFRKKHAQLLSKIRIKVVRFAFDGMHEDGYFQRAIKLAKKYIKGQYRIYVLYNFTDTPEDFYYRVKEVCKLGCDAYPMRFQALDSVEKNFVGEHWKKEMFSRIIDMILIKSPACIDKYGIDIQLGKNLEEFLDRLHGRKKIPPYKSYKQLRSNPNTIELIEEEFANVKTKSRIGGWTTNVDGKRTRRRK